MRAYDLKVYSYLPQLSRGSVPNKFQLAFPTAMRKLGDPTS